MGRRTLKARCTLVGKVKCTSREAAEWWARWLTARAHAKGGIMPTLYCYRCREAVGGCGYWHISHEAPRGTVSPSYPIPEQWSMLAPKKAKRR